MHLKTVTIIHAPLHEDNDRKLECGKIYKRSVEVPTLAHRFMYIYIYKYIYILTQKYRREAYNFEYVFTYYVILYFARTVTDFRFSGYHEHSCDPKVLLKRNIKLDEKIQDHLYKFLPHKNFVSILRFKECSSNFSTRVTAYLII